MTAKGGATFTDLHPKLAGFDPFWDAMRPDLERLDADARRRKRIFSYSLGLVVLLGMLNGRIVILNARGRLES